MHADSLAKNIPIAPESVCPSPKVLDFNAKRLYWASVVRVLFHQQFQEMFLAKRRIKSQNVLGNQTCDRIIILAPFFLDN